MKVLIVFAAFVAAASASVALGGVGVVRTVQPVATNVITPVITPVVRNVVTPVVSRIVSPAVVNTPVLVSAPVVRTVPVVQRQILTTSRLVSPVIVGGLGLGGAAIIGKK